MNKKKCKECQEWKIIEEFYKMKFNSDGRFGKCKICVKKDVIKRYEKSTERKRKYQREYYKRKKSNPEFLKEYINDNAKARSLVNPIKFRKNKNIIR